MSQFRMRFPLKIVDNAESTFDEYAAWLTDADGYGVGTIKHSDELDDLRRVAASVNALAGVSIDAIESGAVADLLKREGLSE